MRKFIGGIVLGLVLGVAATATASSTARSYYLNRGDTAIDKGGETQCTTVGTPYVNSRFVCKVGGKDSEPKVAGEMVTQAAAPRATARFGGSSSLDGAEHAREYERLQQHARYGGGGTE